VVDKQADIIDKAEVWFASQGWEAFDFQKAAWQAYLDGYHGLVNAPTGSGKTYSLFIAACLDFMREHDDYASKADNGLLLIWVTPIRALAKEINNACTRAAAGLGLPWRIETRTGDTTSTQRQKQKKNPPEVLITTPESLHVLMTSRGYRDLFGTVRGVVVDEWHELIGSKRGVQTELFLSRLRGIVPTARTWGISATIGNMEEAVDVLLGIDKPDLHTMIKADIKKEITINSVIPAEIETLPWTGHYGTKMVASLLPIINESKTTLIFTNTRAMCEIWYQQLLQADPDMAGLIAMHHGSISRELRDWVEDALYDGRLKAVVCTSSLDLGVDFRPVETIVQIGSPKGVSRFVQRAGRSGHRPGAASKIYFVPTHSIELVEAAALRTAVKRQNLEQRIPYIRSFDVLVQYLMTLAVAEGFRPEEIYPEIKKTYCYYSVTDEEWQWILNYLVNGSSALGAYDEYQKVGVVSGVYMAMNKKIAMRHRLSIGTIVSDGMLSVKYLRGPKLGTIEEYFISLLSPGDTFWFAGRALELVRIKDMIVQVKKSTSKTGKVPSYMGGRMQLSSQMSETLREKIHLYSEGVIEDPEIEVLIPLFEEQRRRSLIPTNDQLLIEYFETKEGWHLLIYPFEGRNVHEGVGALLATRISRLLPISFSIGMNDYGLELLSDQRIDIETLLQSDDLFTTKDLTQDINSSINAVELSRRKFRDIAIISGLIFTGFPGKAKKDKHLQSSSQLLYEVFKQYDPDNLLYQQTYDEVMTFQLEEARLRSVLTRIQKQNIVITYPERPTPFSFPILVDMLREKMSSERLSDRIAKMQAM
jgi:ATP-dependent Lhr-like helicase